MNNKLKELRKNNGLTLNELSKGTGIAVSTLSQMENGDRKINMDHAKTLSNYFKVTIDFLSGETSNDEYLSKIFSTKFEFANYTKILQGIYADKNSNDVNDIVSQGIFSDIIFNIKETVNTCYLFNNYIEIDEKEKELILLIKNILHKDLSYNQIKSINSIISSFKDDKPKEV